MKTIFSDKLVVAALGSALIAAPLTASAGNCGNGKNQNTQDYQSRMGDRMQAYPARFVPMVNNITNGTYPGAYGMAQGYGNDGYHRVGHHEMHDQAPRAKPATAQKDIIDTAVNAGNFGTLVTAIKAAGLVDTLKGEGPFTVFAPTDEAFAKIPQDQLVALLADKDALIKVLTYHVVAGAVSSSEAARLDSARTVQGSSVTIDATNGVKIDSANVVVADIVTSNGTIHAIDTVIMPN